METQGLTRLNQTVFRDPSRDDSIPGDCFRTCIACILGFEDVRMVPHFVHEDMLGKGHWWSLAWRFVMEHASLQLIETEPMFPYYLDDFHPYVIVGGGSPRSGRHAVIADARTGEVVHDPHPSRAGLLWIDRVYALVPLDFDVPRQAGPVD
jgi:hypothetical protein